MNGLLAGALELLPGYLAAHVRLSAAALVLAVLIAVPLAIRARTRPRFAAGLLGFASLVQTIPSLALLALFYPLLLLLSGLSRSLAGPGIPALGFLPALLALVLYALLPILRNAVAGFKGIDPDLIEAADGVGMTPRQRLRLVELPLAAPVLMAGIRTATVWTIGTATLATTVGQPGLGNFIFSGLQTEDWVSVLVGCVAAAGLALVVDGLLALIESGTARRSRPRLLLGAAGLLAGTLLALLQSIGPERPALTIGAKNFSEQYILAALIADRLEDAGFETRQRGGLGSAVIFRALAAGDLDVYVDYSGTLWANVLGRTDNPPREEMLRELGRTLAARHDVRVLGPLGFENTYALAMRRDRADALGIRSIDDLARHAPRLRLASDLEFLTRPEWAAVERAYGLRFAAARAYSPTFMYRALEEGSADVISAFSSDGRIAAMNLVVLTDPRRALPGYDAVLLLSPARARDPGIVRALTPLLGVIPVERMRAANYLVDRDSGKRSPAQAARTLLPAR